MDTKDPYTDGRVQKANVVSPQVVEAFHQKADTDATKTSVHHTLGPSPNQASPGAHNHDGTSSVQLLAGVAIAGARGGNAALASVIAALVLLGATDNTTP
jgi:hypothetical protein